MSGNKTDHQLLVFLTQPVATRQLRLGLLLAGLSLVWKNLHADLKFDDAFMFYRYALHLREGLGVSWNLDKVPTFGETSPMWGVIVWGASFLPLPAARVLLLASSLSSVCAILAMAFAVVLNAKSAFLKNLTRAAFLIAFPPLSLSDMFLRNTRTGMETMLAFAVNGLVCGTVLIWSREPSTKHGWFVGLASFGAFLARPESALPALLVIALAALLLKSERPRALDALLPICVLCGGISIYAITCKAYFHTAVPLAFYAKGHHFFQGDIGRQPLQRALQFLLACCTSLSLLVWMTKPKQIRIVIVYLIPLLVAIAYLCTVTQIMGQASRYYLPYCPYLIFPAMMVLDEALVEGGRFRVDNPLLRVCLSALMFTAIAGILPERIIQKLDDRVEGRTVRFAEAQREEIARVPLPSVDWEQGWRDITDYIVAGLPRGATVAASEVGYMGAMAPQVNIIDLSGLNNRQFALNRFSMPVLLEGRPDLVWLPHLAYTYNRGVIFDSSDFMSEYTLYDGALTYGIAVRKDSPYRTQIMAGMKFIWAKEYSGYRMEDYEVRSAHWDRTPIPF